MRLYTQENQDGYLQIIINKIDTSNNEIMSFISHAEAKDKLFAITDRYQLCQKVNLLYKTSGPCFQQQLKICHGACLGKEEVQIYNDRVKDFIKTTELQLPNGEVFLQVKGRHEAEKGLIYIKDGTYKGFGFCQKNARSTKTFLKAITIKTENRDSRRIVKRHLM